MSALFSGGEIHLWRASLLVSEKCCDMLSATLAAEERERAERYHSPHHRTAFTVGRGLLRTILSQYLPEKPEEIAITYNAHGKPGLVNSPISFNLAHAGDLMVVAIAPEQTLGIDIEQVRPLAERDGMVRQFFTQFEQQQFFRVAEPERDRAFFRLWTGREALLKASGRGWAEGFAASDSNAELSCFEWDPAEGYVGATAVAGTGWRLVEIPASSLQALVTP